MPGYMRQAVHNASVCMKVRCNEGVIKTGFLRRQLSPMV